MSGGMREMILNPLERALSVDLNRLQKFKGGDIAELLRYWFNVSTSSDTAGGVATEYASVETPLRAEIVNGLCVKPQLANNSCFVDPGVLFAMFPDGSADDSNYKYVKDPGVQTVGQIIIAANAGGNARVDIIECQPVLTTLETDSRDIYNPTTQLFSATTVSKVQAFRLSYRVRSGTVGGGFASVGLAAGWLPLCVAVVAAGSTNNDTVTFYDVRPLLVDRVKQPFNHSLNAPSHCDATNSFWMQHVTGANNSAVMGEARFHYKGRVAGGTFNASAMTSQSGFPGSLASLPTPSAGGSWGSYSLRFWAGWLVFPFGLPRWCQYTTAGSGTRVPGTYRGILYQSGVLPLDASGVPEGDLTLTELGLGGVTRDACFMGMCGFQGTVMANGNRYLYDTSHMPQIQGNAACIASLFLITLVDSWGVYPANAKSVITSINYIWTWAPATFLSLDLRINYALDNLAGSPPGLSGTTFGEQCASGFGQIGIYRLSSDTNPGAMMAHGELPLVTSYPATLGPKTRQVVGTITQNNGSQAFVAVASAFHYFFTIGGYTL